jgi:lactate dehydrogenase-like 2-hydroxyacid dehydrogenase
MLCVYARHVASMNAKYGGEKITCTQLDSVEAVLKTADIVSLHTVLDETNTGMIDKAALEMMKPDAVLVNSSRGPIINETDLVAHLQANPDFRCGALRSQCIHLVHALLCCCALLRTTTAMPGTLGCRILYGRV